MTNMCNGQQQIHIILSVTWIVRAINTVLEKTLKCLGTSTFFFCAGVLFSKNLTIYGHFMNIHENTKAISLPQDIAPKIFERCVLSASFREISTRNR